MQRLLLCGAAAPALLRLMPPSVPAVAVTGLEEAAAADAAPDAAFLALVPGEEAEVPRWAALLEASLPAHGFVMMVSAGADDPRAAALAPSFVPYAEEPLDGGAVFRIHVRSDYNPVAHAAEAGQRADYGAAYEILCLVPDAYLQSPRTAAEMHGARLSFLEAWARQGGLEASVALTKAHTHFFHALAADPACPEAYEALAGLWAWCGDERRSRSVIACHRQAYGSGHDAGQDAPARPPLKVCAPPPSSLPQAIGKMLFVTHTRVHYGLDVLYDGLVQVVGHEKVDIFPHKPSLHGGAPPEHAHYPCTFRHPPCSLDLDRLCAALEAGAYDFVLWGDCEWGLDAETAAAIAARAGTTPIWIVDQADECMNLRGHVEQRLGRQAAGYFKREKVAAVDYGPQSHPLPFAYPEPGVSTVGEGRSGFFWAGQRRFGMRRPLLEYLERALGAPLDAHYSQEAYRARLAESAVGLNLSGGGFDTVRYWELPAHGVVLLSETLPIVIPENFQDGEDALFFDTPQECAERLAWALAHPEETAALAERGLARFRRHHTGAARARQLLDTVAAAARGAGA